MDKGKHLTDAGINDIVNIRATINTGLRSTPALKAGFPQVNSICRPLIEKQLIPHEA